MRQPLTPRQEEILELYARGLSTREVASELGNSPATVRTLMQTALRRTQSRSSVHLMARWCRGEFDQNGQKTTEP